MGRRSRGKRSGLFHWRWRLGLFENAAQVGNALHTLKGLGVLESMELVSQIQEEHQGKATDPKLIWREAKRRAG